jgi:arylsulfatase A-like enzyme
MDFWEERPTSGAPFVYDGTTPQELPSDPNYHFMADMTDKAISWMKFQKALAPEKPFFMYFAPGATHAPHHVPAEWIAKWKGKFDGGWDVLRKEILARQIKLGIVPKGTKLAPKPDAIPDWDKLTKDQKTLFAPPIRSVRRLFGLYGPSDRTFDQSGRRDRPNG